MIKFLIESSICLGLFYSVYWLFLRKEKLLSVNRVFLLFAVLMSLIIPLVEFSFQPEWTSTVQVLSIPAMIGEVTAMDTVEPTGSFNLLTTIYYSGLFITVIFFLVKFYLTSRRLKISWFKRSRGVQIVEVEGYHAFSFLNTIVLGRQIQSDPDLRSKVLSHEMAHVKEKHSIDLLLMGLLKCVFWFNPFIYFTTASLKTQHEYIADQHVLKEFSPMAYERSLAAITLAKIDQSLVHAFAKLPIDNRIKMIYTTNSNIMNKFKLLFALPILALLVFQFSCADDPFQPIDELPDQGMTAKLEPSIHAYNIAMNGEDVKKEGISIAGVVTDLNGSHLSGVKVKTSNSGVETTSDQNGKFILKATDADKELILSHPDRRLSRIAIGENSGMETIDMIEVPDEMEAGDKTATEIVKEYKVRVKQALSAIRGNTDAKAVFELKEETEVPVDVSNIKLVEGGKFKVMEETEIPFRLDDSKIKNRKKLHQVEEVSFEAKKKNNN